MIQRGDFPGLPASPNPPPERTRPSLCIVKGSGPVETFVRAHADGLPARVTLIHDLPPRIDDRPIFSHSPLSRALRKAGRLLRRREWEWEITSAFRVIQPSAATGVMISRPGTAGSQGIA